MPLTPDTGASPYCDAPTFLLFYDNRRVGQLVRDDDSQATAAELLVDPVLARCLAHASGELESACLVGGRYRPADLQALAGNGAALLASLVADLAYGKICRRRGLPAAEMPQVEAAEAKLKALEAGEAALPFLEVEQAGLVAVAPYTPADLLALDRPTDRARRYFGGRGRALGGWYCN